MIWYIVALWLATGFLASRYVCHRNKHTMDSECLTVWVVASLLGPFAFIALRFKDE